MPTFNYTARNAQSQIVKGSVSATTRDAASQTIIKQGLRPILVKVEGRSSSERKDLFDFLHRIKGRDLVIFTRQLSTMISAGVPIAGALSTLKDQTENQKFKQQLDTVVKDVEGGAPLADALQKHPTTFSPIYVNMVRAGEAGGILDDILKKLALQEEKDAAIRSKVKSATAYPLVLLFITIVAFFILTIFVVPKIGAIVTNLSSSNGGSAKLPPITRAMLSISAFIRHQWYIVFGILVGAPLLINYWRRSASGKPQFDAFLLKIPIIKTVITKVAIARFARTFASLMGAGVSVLEALQVTAQAIGNSVIEKELLDAGKEVKAGKQLSQPLSQSKIFPPIIAQMLKVGEETGQTDVVLVKVADFYEEDVDTLVNGLSSILEPIMIVIMGSMVGLIAVSVLQPIVSLNQSLQ